MVFHWRLNDRKSPQVSRTLLSILAVFNIAVVWMVSTRSPTSKSSSPFNNPLVTVPKAPITIGIIVTFMFHSFFYSLARSRYLYLFSHSFSFILWSAGTAKSTILQILFFFLLLLLSLGILGHLHFFYLLTSAFKKDPLHWTCTINAFTFYLFSYSSLYALQFDYYTPDSMYRHWNPRLSTLFYMRSNYGFIHF